MGKQGQMVLVCFVLFAFRLKFFTSEEATLRKRSHNALPA
jgi:hypothetical protein